MVARKACKIRMEMRTEYDDRTGKVSMSRKDRNLKSCRRNDGSWERGQA
jgi:hypothetical protein